MAVSSVTIRAVQALKPGETIWDADHREAVRGFGVRRQRDQATYVLKYRVFGRQRFVTIGAHGAPWTPELARREAKRLLGLVANGKDPADEKAKARLQAADTLRAVADQYLRNAKQRLKPRTYSEIERYILVSWKPLHAISVFQITRRHVSARIAHIASGHGTVSAARARTALSSMFNWAIREGLDIASNPVLGTNRPVQPGSRERVLTDTELSAIWWVSGDDDYGRIVRLLLLTAQRRDEVGSMQWPELDLSSGLWTLPGARTKNRREHLLPLVPAARALLPAWKRSLGAPGLDPSHGALEWRSRPSIYQRAGIVPAYSDSTHGANIAAVRADEIRSEVPISLTHSMYDTNAISSWPQATPQSSGILW